MPKPWFIALAFLMVCACGDKSKKMASASDEASSSHAVQGALAELAGSWSGSASITGYGTAVATATLDHVGQGHYFVSVSGNHRQGLFRVLSWDRSYLLIEAQGHRERIHATHKGDRLWLDTALIGQVLLQRSPP